MNHMPIFASSHACMQICDSLAGLAGLPSRDAFDPRVLQPEPVDRVRRVLHEARRIHGL